MTTTNIRHDRFDRTLWRSVMCTVMAMVSLAIIAAAPAVAAPAPIAITATSGPMDTGSTNLSTVNFTLSAVKTGSVLVDFGCSMDGAAFDACNQTAFPTCDYIGSSKYTCHQDRSYSGLAEGTHKFKAIATVCSAFDDCSIEANWVDGPELTISFTVDQTAPITSIISGPADNAKIRTANTAFAFVTNGWALFSCSVDGKAFVPCVTPLSFAKLKNGLHSFAVRATDAAGNVGLPATRSFKVAVKKAKKRCRRVHGKRKCKKVKS